MHRLLSRLALALLVLGVALPASATTFYVATTGGNDARSCVTAQTIGTPKATLNSAVACLTPGDTLDVRAGTYAESLLNNIPSGTSWNAKVRIVAHTGETVWMHPTSGSYVINIRGLSQYIEFDGINVDGDGVISNAIKIESYNASNHPHHIRIQNAEVMGASTTADTDQSRSGILITDMDGLSTGSNELINLAIHRMRSKYIGTSNQGSVGLYIQGPSNLVDGCDFYDFRFGGFQIYSAYGYPSNSNIIRNSKVHDPTRVTGAPHVGMTVYSTTSGTLIYNNLIYNIQSDGANTKGIEYGTGAAGVGLYNNTFYNVSGTAIHVQANVNTVKNNIVYGSTTAAILASGTVASNNLLGTSPSFTDAAGGDFTLQTGSVAVNAGATIGSVTTDRIGTARPQGAAYDIGAYEQLSAGVAPSAPSGLTVGTPTTSSLPLTWTDNSSNETSFELQRSTDNVTFGALATPATNAVSYTNTGLTATTTYYYRIRSRNSVGSLVSAWSTVAVGTTLTPTVTPPPPTTIALTAVKKRKRGLSVTNLSWTNTTGPVDVLRNGTKIATTSNTIYADQFGVVTTGTYSYRACVSGSTTACSNTVSVTF